MKDTFVVIAAYNAEDSIGKVVKKLLKKNYSIVVVDDGSKDSTLKVASKYPVFLLRHIINRGQGAALKTGIDFALQKGAKYIITFDADDQHRVEDLPAMLKPVKAGKVDIAIGSRFLKDESDIPFIRKFLLKGSVIVLRMMYGVPITDAHNGLRCMSRKTAQKIELKSDRMEHASEFIEQIKKKHLKYKEIPVVIRYTDETLQRGHGGFMQAIKILARMVYKKIMD